MERRTIKICAALTAILPFAFIVWSHTQWWPELFAEFTDIYIPQGPTETYSDFSPGDRTGTLTTVAGRVVRPIIDSPVYLLFQPRRHSKYIAVEISVYPMDLAPQDMPRIGYRHGKGPEGNIFVETDYFKAHEGLTLYATLPLDDMTRERIDARRIVIDAPTATTSTPVYITQTKFYYED